MGCVLQSRLRAHWQVQIDSVVKYLISLLKMVGTTLGCFTSLMVCILGIYNSFHFFFCNVFQIFAFLSWASGFLYSLSFSIPGPCCVLAVLALLSLFALSNAFPAFRSQPKPRSLGEPFLSIPSVSPPLSCLSESCHSSHSSSCLCFRISFTAAIFTFAQLIIPFIPFFPHQTEDYVREGNTSVFAHRCIIQVSSRSLTEASASICGIHRLWTDGWRMSGSPLPLPH